MTSPSAGWYPDPAGAPNLQRYWDGTSWTQQTQPAPVSAAPPQAGYGPTGPQFGGGYPGPYPSGGGYPPSPFGTGPPGRSGSQTFWARNQLAAITVGICVVYGVIDFYAHFVFIGILPILFTIRSFRRREPLAAVALVATVIVVGISLFSLNR